jgi:mRNA-degrading endonuclease YafQ of YafQ-DinJ toxin-antitoxin module
MTIHFTIGFKKKTAKLSGKNPQLLKQLKKQFKLFTQNPLHKGVRLHKLKGRRSEQYAIWIEGDLRALAFKDNNMYIFFDLVTHDQY